MIEVKKLENESMASLLRRFNRRIKISGILLRARELQFKNRPKSELKKKIGAIKNFKLKQKLEYLRKLGKIE